jgi:hypothetical protein
MGSLDPLKATIHRREVYRIYGNVKRMMSGGLKFIQLIIGF